MKKKLYILDVSGFIFRAYYAIPPMTNSRGESTNALFGFIRSVIKLFKECVPEHAVAVFDGPDNKKQRLEIYEKYKANRIKLHHDLPLQMELAKTFCDLMGIPHVEVGGVEADDTMGSIAKWAEQKSAEVYLCTSDKDLCQLVNENIFVLNPWKENIIIDRQKVEELFGVPPEKIIDLLAIMGDASDNIPGLTGFGPKTAVPLLQEFGSLENLLHHPEKVKGAKKQETLKAEAEIALLSKRLATIHTDIDFDKDHNIFPLRTPDVPGLKDFYLDMEYNSLVRELDEVLQKNLPAEKVDYYIVDDENALEELFSKLEESEEVSFDIETTNLHPLLAKPVGFGFSVKEKQAYYIPCNGKLGSEFVIKKLQDFFEKSRCRFYGHNVKYDCHILENVCIPIPHISFDTVLASYLLNSSSRRHTLDHLALHYFGKVKTTIQSLIGTGKKEIPLDQVPIDKVADYCCQGVDYTLRIKNILQKELEKRQLSPLLYELELPLSNVLKKMEHSGMFVDVASLNEMSRDLTKDLKVLEQTIYQLAGEEFNINSPKQLSHILFEKLGIKSGKKTATGLSTNAEVLELLAIDYPIAEKIIEYRGLEKLRSTYVDSLPLEVNPKTGRIHPTFNQFVAATGRLACQDPNLQNIPVRSEQGRKIRKAFRPQKSGWSYLAADYSQIELRLLAHLSEDPKLIKAFNEGEDIHAYTASLVFEIPINEVTKQQRYQAKAINFGIIYGQQAYGLSKELGVDVRKAAEFITAYFERYPKVFEFVEACIKLAKHSGKTVTMIGREREIPEIHSSNAIIRSMAERLAINTPLQGSAADLIKLAMLKINDLLDQKKLHSFMVLQIHDELIFEAPDEELEELIPLVKNTMEGIFSLKVPLVVDVIVGKNWGEC